MKRLALALALAGCAPPPPPAPPPAAQPVVMVQEPSEPTLAPLPPPAAPADCAAAAERGSIEFCGQTLSTSMRHVACHRPFEVRTAPLACLLELRSLTLRGTHVARLDALRGLEHLARINLSYTKVARIEALAELPALRELALDATAVVDLSPLTKAPSLEKLRLRRSAWVDWSTLGALRELRDLDLTDSRIDDLSALAGHPQLAHLRISDAVPDLAPLATASQLRVLEIRRHHDPSTHGRDDPFAARRRAILAGVGALTQLRQLDLLDLQITSVEPLKPLTSLAQLWLGAPQVESLAPLASLEGLTFLGIDNGLGREDELRAELTSLGASLPGLTSLTVLTSPHDTSYLRAFAKVEGLALSATGGRPFDLGGVALMPSLVDLDLHQGDVEHLTPLSRVRSLRSVVLEPYVTVPQREVDALRQARRDLRIERKPSLDGGSGDHDFDFEDDEPVDPF